MTATLDTPSVPAQSETYLCANCGGEFKYKDGRRAVAGFSFCNDCWDHKQSACMDKANFLAFVRGGSPESLWNELRKGKASIKEPTA